MFCTRTDASARSLSVALMGAPTVAKVRKFNWGKVKALSVAREFLTPRKSKKRGYMRKKTPAGLRRGPGEGEGKALER